MNMIGLDIGGANLKASDGQARSLSQPFAMWEKPELLAATLQAMLNCFRPFDAVALTMTGELADCFNTKSEGVEHITHAVEEAVRCPVHVWQTVGEFVAPDVAREFPVLTAAANWHALATWAGRMASQEAGLLIDVGSTTCDVIPLLDGMPVPQGRTDLERLLSGELIYTGVRRTPVCAVADSVPIGDQQCPIAAELFATMEDVSLILEEINEDQQRRDTADGRPATRKAAFGRLARMQCCDATELTEWQIVAVAKSLRGRQLQLLQASAERVMRQLPSKPRTVLLSGEGEFLARMVLSKLTELSAAQILSLTNALGANHSEAACAYALARLGRERIG